MAICTKCIIPDSFVGIAFEAGRCSFCRDAGLTSFFNQPPAGKEKLQALLNSSKAGNGYDCVVPLSGGKDSSYILYYLVKILGLRPLAVHYDSGFRASASLANIKNVTEKLSVELVTHRATPSHRRLIRQALLNGKSRLPLWVLLA